MRLVVRIGLNRSDRLRLRKIGQFVTKKRITALILTLGFATSLAAYSGIVKTNTFSPGSSISSSQVNANFDQLFTEVNRIEDIIYPAVGGNVGLGTTSPASHLEIRGSITNQTAESMIRLYRPIQSGVYFPSNAELRLRTGAQGNSTELDFSLTQTNGTDFTDVLTLQTATTGNLLQLNGNATISGTINQDPWISMVSPTNIMANGWTTFDGNPPPNAWAPPGYFKDKVGIVHLRGLIKNGTCGQNMFTLPAGYRPMYQTLLTSFSANNTAVRIDIYPAGTAFAGSNCNNGWVSLDALSFRADN